MKKIIYIIPGILIIIAVILIMLNVYKKTSPETSQPAPSKITSLPSSEDLAKQGKVALPAGQESVVINDPYKESLKTISENAELRNTSDYEIVYLGKLKSFVITLYGENLNDSRIKAEQAFLESLGITKDEACKLNVNLAVAHEASESAAGKNYGLSFCSSGKPFPEK